MAVAEQLIVELGASDKYSEEFRKFQGGLDRLGTAHTTAAHTMAKPIETAGMRLFSREIFMMTGQYQALSPMLPLVSRGIEGLGRSMSGLLGPVGLVMAGISSLVIIYRSLSDSSAEAVKAAADVTDVIMKQAEATGVLTSQQRALLAARLTDLETRLIEARGLRDLADQQRKYTETVGEFGIEHEVTMTGAGNDYLKYAAQTETLAAQIKTIRSGLAERNREASEKEAEAERKLGLMKEDLLRKEISDRDSVAVRASAAAASKFAAEVRFIADSQKLASKDAAFKAKLDKFSGDVAVAIKAEEVRQILSLNKERYKLEIDLAFSASKATGRIIAEQLAGQRTFVESVAASMLDVWIDYYEQLLKLALAAAIATGQIDKAVAASLGIAALETVRQVAGGMKTAVEKSAEELGYRAPELARMPEDIIRTPAVRAGAPEAAAGPPEVGGRAVAGGFQQQVTQIFIQASVQAIDVQGIGDTALRQFAMKIGMYIREGAAAGNLSLR